MSKSATKILSMFLALVMLFQLTGVTQLTAYAADETDEELSETLETETTGTTESTQSAAQILYEDDAQREEYSKRYRMSDGTWMAVVYDDAVHYQSDGEWKEIDNTLKSETQSYRIPEERGNVTGRYTVDGFVEGADTEVLMQETELITPVSVEEPKVTSTPVPAEVTDSMPAPEPAEELETTEVPAATEIPAVVENMVIESDLASEEVETTPEISEVDAPDVESTPEVEETPAVEVTPEAEDTLVIEETPVPETEETVVENESITENPAIELQPITSPVVTLTPVTPGFKDVTEQMWTNTANDFGISLPASLNGDSRIRVSNKGYDLYFAPILENEVSGGNVSTFAMRDSAITPQMMTIDNSVSEKRLEGTENNARSGLVYEDIMPGVDLEYVLRSRSLKETIVIDSAANMPDTIGYTISAAGLTPVMNADNSIDFTAEETVIFHLPAPYMFDAADVYSHNIGVTLEALDNGEYLLTYTPDAQWLAAEERVWPVCIDPVAGITPSTSTVEDTFVCANTATKNYEGLNYLYVGKLDSEGAARAYVKFKSLPSLTSSDVVLNAYMYMQGIEMSGDQMTVSAYRVASTWSKSSLTWNTKPSTDYAALDYQIVAYANRYKAFCWDITQAAKQWYNGSANYGIELRSDKESSSTGVVIRFGSAERAAGLRPNLVLYYTSNTGLESFWDYTSQDVGRAGTAHVNNFTGNLVVSRTDMSYGGNKMPAAITFNYNFTDRGTELGYGYGWRMNYNHKITIETGSTSAGSYTYYRWVDGDGTRRNFNFASSHWYDETGQGYILTENASSTTARFVITDKSGSKLEFDSYGRLKKVVDPNVSSNCVTIDYVASSSDNLRISKITDGAGRVYSFTYGSTTVNRLSKITYTGTGTSAVSTVSYGYGSSGVLSTVTYPDSGTASYGYSSTSLTTLQNNVNGEAVTVTYNSGNRVGSMTFKDGSTVVSSAAFSYGGDSTKVTDRQGCWVTYQFNDFGNTSGVYNDRGQAVFGSYAQDKDSSARANQLVDSSRLQDTVVNLIKDPSFETGTGWNLTNCTTDTSVKSTGAKSAKLASSSKYASYAYSVTQNKTYTFSAAVKTDSAAKARAAVHSSSPTGTVLAASEPINATDWTRIEVTYTPTTSGTVYFVLEETATGVVYLDDAQLESADASSRYNLLTNGDFSEANGSTGWDIVGWTGYGVSGVDGQYVSTDTSAWTPEVTDENVLILDKSYLVEKSACQVVQIPDGALGDRYTFGVWVKSPSVPLDNSRAPDDTAVRRCGIKVRAVNSSGAEVASEQILINDACNDWQYICGSLDCDAKYTSIEVYLLFSYCQNTAMFDGAQLFRESFGYHYEYDDSGNVTKITDLAGNDTTYTYGNGNSDVTMITMPNGSTYTYTYNSARQVTQDKNTLNTTNQYTYDTYGNLTKQTTGYSGASASIVSESTYEGSGNMTKTVTTADRQTITYSNNLNKSLVNSVTDPLGRVTSYTYDTMDRPLTVTRNSSVLTYTYSADAVSTIKHTGDNPTTYTFTYGLADLLNSVKVGTTALVANTYNSLTWNLLKQTYANGAVWSYEYYTDVNGHQTSELKSKSDGTNKFVYYYSNDGAVARIEYKSGNTLKRVEKYYYDTADRLCRVFGLNENTTNPSVLYEYSWTYDHNNNVTNLVEVIGGVKTTYNYGYNTEQQASSTAYGNTNKTFAYDGYGRFSNSIVYSGSAAANNERIKEYVEYKTTGNYATNQVSKFISKWSKSSTNYSSDTYQYTYDANGNITAIKDGNGANLVTYQYDSNDQLIWERNYITIGDDTNGRAYKYTYDTGGNILSKTTYSSADATSGGTEVKYTYGDSVWGDKLTKYNGVDTEADASGNIKKLNGWTFEYQGGRQLYSATSPENVLYTFTYNDSGLRICKTGGGVTHDYTYNGSLLASDVTSTYALYFRYDQNGAPIGFAYKTGSTTTEYYYLKNLQGDITGIVDTAGNRVATYTYDAWGNPLSTTGSNTDLAKKNPLRYRSYVFDTESGLYYLQSRYYSPAIGRFISADTQLNNEDGILGLNMFAYCSNNPVMYVDPEGHGIILSTLVAAGIGAVVGGILSAAVAVQNGTSVTSAFVIGAAAGAVSGAGCTLLAAVEIGTAVGAFMGAILCGTVSAVANLSSQYREFSANYSAEKSGESSSSAKMCEFLDTADYSSTLTSTAIGMGAGLVSVPVGILINGALSGVSNSGSNLLVSSIANSEVGILQGVIEFFNQ